MADKALERYYRFHSKIYDMTRWSFLFGRREIVQRAAASRPDARQILEVGCSTGRNLRRLARLFPEAHLTGLDLSADMLAVAARKLGAYKDRITLIRKPYGEKFTPAEPPDIILFSYTLSMINPGWERCIGCAKKDLADKGVIAVTDFSDTNIEIFRRWMSMNHVQVRGHLLPELRKQFSPLESGEIRAYGGTWSYMHFIGEKNTA